MVIHNLLLVENEICLSHQTKSYKWSQLLLVLHTKSKVCGNLTLLKKTQESQMMKNPEWHGFLQNITQFTSSQCVWLSVWMLIQQWSISFALFMTNFTTNLAHEKIHLLPIIVLFYLFSIKISNCFYIVFYCSVWLLSSIFDYGYILSLGNIGG